MALVIAAKHELCYAEVGVGPGCEGLRRLLKQLPRVVEHG